MRRLAPLLAALALASCGGDDGTPSVREGPPADRHGQQVLEHYGSVEAVRAEIVAASDGYVAGLREDALGHLETAEDAYVQLLSGLVGAEDATLARELLAAFRTATGDMRSGRDRRGVKTRLGYISGQLLDGALAALIPRAAREDPGVKAEVLLGLLGPLEVEYLAATQAGIGSAQGRQAAQTAYGLLGRAQALARSIGKSFGPQLDDVSEGLGRVRELVYPLGIAAPEAGKQRQVQASLDRVRAAVAERFGLPAPAAAGLGTYG